MIFHLQFQNDTMHWQEYVEIAYMGEPVVIGYREQTSYCFWYIPIEASKE